MCGGGGGDFRRCHAHKCLGTNTGTSLKRSEICILNANVFVWNANYAVLYCFLNSNELKHEQRLTMCLCDRVDNTEHFHTNSHRKVNSFVKNWFIRPIWLTLAVEPYIQPKCKWYWNFFCKNIFCFSVWIHLTEPELNFECLEHIHIKSGWERKWNLFWSFCKV